MDENQIIRLDEINFRIIIKDLLWHFPYIILAVLIAIMGVRTYKNIVYTPEYTASATMAVMAKGNADASAYSSLTTANSMAEVFTEVFQSEIMKEKVDKDLGKSLDGVKISSSLIPETNLLVLNVTANDPKTSYMVILSIIENYKYVSDYLFSNAVLEVIMDPVVPMAPSNSFSTKKLDFVSVFAMLALVCGSIVLLSIFRKTIKTTKAGKRNLEGKHLGTIPFEVKNRTFKAKVNKTNKALVIGSNVLNFRYEESFQNIAGRVEHTMEKENKKVLIITSVAENEGKSTIAVNLATALARRNKKVLLIDLDFIKPALHKIIEKRNELDNSFAESLKSRDRIENFIKYDKKQNIYVMLNNKRIKKNDNINFEKRIQARINEASEEFDFVIIDSAPISVGTDTEYIKDFADCSLVVVRQDIVDIPDINDAIEMLKEGKSEFIGYILNSFDISRAGGRKYYDYGKYSYE